MYRENIIKFALEHPEAIDGIQVQLNARALPHLLKSELWPKAVQDSLIVDEENDEQRDIRARAVMSRYVMEDFSDRKFLDFGSGNSGCVKFAKNAKEAVAFDIAEHKGVTTDIEEVKAKGPYDIILLYDVIDHLVDKNGEAIASKGIDEVMKLVASLLKADGVIYVRCHPWTARHGTHAYHTNNKAFIQYYQEDHGGIPTVRIVEPVVTYKAAFEAANLEVNHMEKVEQVLEPIFEDKIFDVWQQNFTWRNKEIFRKIMTINFVDFKLSRQS